MASANRVFLIGVVATPPVDRDDGVEFILGVPQERSGRAWLERLRIVATGHLVGTARELRTAQAVYADGRLARSSEGVAVIAATIIALAEPAAEQAAADQPIGTHASPRAHDRAGHARRLHRGTPQERVTWVRPTRVGDPTRTIDSQRRR